MLEVAHSGNIFAWIFLLLSFLFAYGLLWNKDFVVNRDKRFLRIKTFDRHYMYPFMTPYILRIILRLRAIVAIIVCYKVASQIAIYMT